MNQEKKWVVYTPENAKDDEVFIEYGTHWISASYPHNNGFNDLVKSLKLEWERSKGRYIRYINDLNGSVEDRLVELLCMLLAHGYAVEVDNEVLVKKALEEDYEPETNRWILYVSGEDGEDGHLKIKYPYSEAMNSNVRKLPKAEFYREDRGGYWRVPLRYHQAVSNFALDFCFSVSRQAKEAMQSYQNKHEERVKERVLVRTQQLSKRRKSAPTKRRIESIEELLNEFAD